MERRRTGTTAQGWAALGPEQTLEPYAYELPSLDRHGCVVRVLNCGLCRTDISLVDNIRGGTEYPFVPGHEVVGEVVEISEDVENVSVGDRVGVGLYRGSCLKCRKCLSGDDNLCDGAQTVLAGWYGGFSSHIVVDARWAFHIPAGIASASAGPLMCAGATVYAGLLNAGMKGGQRIGVIGVGGLGHLAVQFARVFGNEVTAYVTHPSLIGLAEDIGAHEVVVVTPGEPPASPKEKLDIQVATVAVPLDWNAYLDQLDSDGTLAILGMPVEPLDIVVDSLLFKRRSVTSSPVASRLQIKDMLRIADLHGVEPLVEMYPMDKVNDAIADLRSGHLMTVRNKFRAALQVS